MDERRPQTSTPETMANHTGNDHSTHGANTNLDPALQGGPATASDQAATQEIEQRRSGDTREAESG
ncbi:hypothetical protein [Deinococcus multiflagellatus]|uniref:Uncharacterized protein n=1 Tax=Deinococcus multiflagellatus TaxID=1656887 RepID=A0ABW1ZK38_9DEIO|nr:hypothetical protein [Deinococcus multiflagellatus]MBZ9712485.1 hypothetical protein [Deinococcus multiflagellatus]